MGIGYNVVGFISGQFGLSIAARNTVAQLLSSGREVAIYDIPLSDGRSGLDKTYEHLYSAPDNPLPHQITIFHINPDLISHLTAGSLRDKLYGKMNVCVPFWELPRIPDPWVQPLQSLDVILAPSHFIEHAITTAVSGCDVYHYPQITNLPESIVKDRTAFGLPENSTLFVTSFDIASDLNRKNPLGVIEAFKYAFPPSVQDAGLVLKVNKSVSSAFFDRLHSKLHQLAASDVRIRIIDTTMSYTEIISLYASCDIYVSLHRAEGLGLGPMEAMTLGMPVIATNWSGTTDFMTPFNSCPVHYQNVPCDSALNPSIDPSRLGFIGHWADPDSIEAARWMRFLAEDRTVRERIGNRARDDMRQRQHQFGNGGTFDLLESIMKKYQEGIYIPKYLMTTHATCERELPIYAD